MASSLSEIQEHGEHPLFPRLKLLPASASDARLNQFQHFAAGLEAHQTARGDGPGFFRGLCFALVFEALGGAGIYLLWSLWHKLG